MSSAMAGSVSVTELLGLFPEPVALFDADGKVVAINPGFQALFRPIEQFTRPGVSWDVFLAEVERKDIFAPDACDDLRRAEGVLSLRPSEVPVVEARLREGSHAEVALTSLSDGGFAMRIAVGDGSDREEREIEQVMSKVLEACPTSLTMARIGDGQILYRSPSATELLGKGLNSHDHFVHREERADFVTALLPDARVDDMRVTGRKGDGTEFPAAISARLIDYRGEDVVVYSVFNLSDEIAMQSELARQKDRTFRAEKMSALGELLAGVAHELNNPLSIVVGNMLILKEEELDPALLGRVEKVSDAAERCVRIVRSFLAMARERPLELSAVSPAVLVDAAVDSFYAGTQDAEVDVVPDVAENLPEIWVDETQVVQVLTNLFVNAAQAMSESGVGNRIRLRAETVGDLGFLRLVVSDDGPGVPKEIEDKIFDPLFTTKSAGKGTGVGLALCNRIVTSHGGSIALQQEAGSGACFVLDLPVAERS